MPLSCGERGGSTSSGRPCFLHSSSKPEGHEWRMNSEPPSTYTAPMPSRSAALPRNALAVCAVALEHTPACWPAARCRRVAGQRNETVQYPEEMPYQTAGSP